MKGFKQHILEKLRVSKNNYSYEVTLESLCKALSDYKKRNDLFYVVYIDLGKVFKTLPVVLQYHRTYTDKNIKGNEIRAIRYIGKQVTHEEMFSIYFDPNLITDSIQIENTKELNDIFGEEVLNEIYDYVVKH